MTTLTRDEYRELTYSFDDVRSDYSGRGMYGDTCLGYVGSEPHLFIFDLAKLLVERDSGESDADEIRDKMERLGLGRTDSMGYETIYYFPSITVESADDEEDEE